MKIEIRDHVVSIVTTIGQITRNDTMVEVNGTSAIVSKTLEFCVDKGKFGKIETDIPFMMNHRTAESLKNVASRIKSNSAFKYIDFRKPETVSPDYREYDYCDIIITDNAISEPEKFSVKKDDAILDDLGKFYMPVFLDYVKLDKLKLV